MLLRGGEVGLGVFKSGQHGWNMRWIVSSGVNLSLLEFLYRNEEGGLLILTLSWFSIYLRRRAWDTNCVGLIPSMSRGSVAGFPDTASRLLGKIAIEW